MTWLISRAFRTISRHNFKEVCCDWAVAMTTCYLYTQVFVQNKQTTDNELNNEL